MSPAIQKDVDFSAVIKYLPPVTAGVGYFNF